MSGQATIEVFEEKNIWKILMKIAPPVMLAQLILSFYNIVDSYFVGKFSGDGLTALSIIYPIQLIVIAIAVGTGVGINTLMSRFMAHGRKDDCEDVAGIGTGLAILSWFIFAVLSIVFLEPFIKISAESEAAVDYALTYGHIVCIGSLGIFLESTWTKELQAVGNMRRPMFAQVIGAATNIVLDPIFIFGFGFIPAMGIKGAAIATVMGQFIAAFVTLKAYRKIPKFNVWKAHIKEIYRMAYPSIFMQMLFTVYILALNLILAGFSDEAVTVLGLYYKIQAFFFIPLTGLQTCIIPLLSYLYAQRKYDRCKLVLRNSMIISLTFMILGVICFEFIPKELLSIFTQNEKVLEIGEDAFRIIAISFAPAVVSLMMPIFFMAIGAAIPSTLLSLTRQVFCLIPIFWLFSKIGLMYTWIAFPLSEIITGSLGTALYLYQIHKWKSEIDDKKSDAKGEIAMKMITAIVNKKDVHQVCEALTEAGFYFTKMATSGGFLTVGNTTLMIGVEKEKVEKAINVIRENCSKRIEQTNSTIQTGVASSSSMSEVVVGGATIFVTDVESFEKI